MTTLVLVTGRDGIGIHLHEGETLDDRMDAAKAGDRRALARLLSSIENGELHIEESQRNDSEWKILVDSTRGGKILSSRSPLARVG